MYCLLLHVLLDHLWFRTLHPIWSLVITNSREVPRTLGVARLQETTNKHLPNKAHAITYRMDIGRAPSWYILDHTTTSGRRLYMINPYPCCTGGCPRICALPRINWLNGRVYEDGGHIGKVKTPWHSNPNPRPFVFCNPRTNILRV
jgi:hypothetical protein